MDSKISIKLQLYKLSKSQILLGSSLFVFLLIILTILSHFIVSSIISDISVSVFKCSATKDHNCYYTSEVHEVWEATIPSTSRLSQFLYMSITPRSKQSIEFNLDMEIEVLHNDRIVQKRTKHQNVVCHGGKTCDAVQIFYMPYVEFKSYTVKIKHKSPILSDSMYIHLLKISEEFSKYQIILKYIYFSISLVSFIRFLKQTLKIPYNLWTYESKALIPLGISLIIFNEPLILATIYYMNPFWSAVSVFSNSQFMAVILLFWFMQLHHYNDSKFKKSFIIIETSAIAALLSLCFFFNLHLHKQLKKNPTYDWQNDLSESYKRVFIIIIVISLILFTWMAALVVSIATKIRTLSYREKIIKVLSLFMVGFTFCGIFIGAFQPLPRNSSFLFFFLSGFNLYVTAMQFLYSPTRKSLYEFQTKKNFEDYADSNEKELIEIT